MNGESTGAAPAPNNPLSPSRCEKCGRRMNVFTTRRTPTKIIRTKQCERPECGNRIRTEERVISASAPGRRVSREPRPAA